MIKIHNWQSLDSVVSSRGLTRKEFYEWGAGSVSYARAYTGEEFDVTLTNTTDRQDYPEYYAGRSL